MAKPERTRKLTPRQQRFIAEYLCSLNATQAAVRAGYSPKNSNVVGPRLLVSVGVQQAIEKALEARAERTEITADLVVQGLLTEARTYGDGSSHSARVAAWAHLGKHLGMFHESDRASEQPVQVTSVTVVVPVRGPEVNVVEGEGRIIEDDD